VGIAGPTLASRGVPDFEPRTALRLSNPPQRRIPLSRHWSAVVHMCAEADCKRFAFPDCIGCTGSGATVRRTPVYELGPDPAGPGLQTPSPPPGTGVITYDVRRQPSVSISYVPLVRLFVPKGKCARTCRCDRCGTAASAHRVQTERTPGDSAPVWLAPAKSESPSSPLSRQRDHVIVGRSRHFLRPSPARIDRSARHYPRYRRAQRFTDRPNSSVRGYLLRESSGLIGPNSCAGRVLLHAKGGVSTSTDEPLLARTGRVAGPAPSNPRTSRPRPALRSLLMRVLVRALFRVLLTNPMVFSAACACFGHIRIRVGAANVWPDCVLTMGRRKFMLVSTSQLQ